MVDATFALSAVLTVILGGTLLLVCLLHLSYSWQKTSKSGARLPAGSLGVPILGESLALGANPLTYYNERIKKYGRVFKSNLFSRPAIVGTTPEFAKLVIGNSSLFPSGWPVNIRYVLGDKGFAFGDGPQHINIKKVIQKTLLPESLMTRILPLEDIILRHLNKWADYGSLVSKKGCKQIALDLGMYAVLGIPDIGATSEGKMALRKCKAVSKALYSPPIYLPGCNFYRGVQAKRWVAAYVKRLIEERKGKENPRTDSLGVLIAAREDVQSKAELKNLDDDTIADSLNTVFFGAYDSTATNLVWVIKYLNDYPEVFKKVKAEQDEIIKQKLAAGEDPSRLTWEDTKKMAYTLKFVFELLRIVSIPGIVIRRSVEDVEFDGKLIPKNWAIVLMVNAIHQNPELYPDPFKFDPSRFDTAPKPYEFIPFSSGSHMCPANEFARLVILIYIHHIVTGFAFQSTAPDQGIVYDSFPSPKGGFPISFQRRKDKISRMEPQ